MATRGVSFVEQHFFLSNRLVQLVLGLHRNQSSNNQLLLLSTIIAYVLPIIIYQLYQLFTMDFNLTTAVIELRKIIAAFIMLSAYSNANFHFVTVCIGWKIQQQFTNDSKYIHRSLCSQKSQQEFHWIIDVIKCYRNVTECQIPFYLLPTKTQKLLLFMIARSMKPCMLSIGGLFVSSHEVFSQLLQKAFSFAMVYYNVQ
uniref:Uncharacterized protein n=1 Tax=Vespula pensylvanica TaxID=30213 RepID=A0A834KS68_VESPE|nr:hypothetical protein H0235_013649 [Vespula pensylvanica]